MAITKILHDEGYSVAPFKAQNVSNNARIADDNSEIAEAQFFAAEAINLPTSYEMNPILIKSGAKGKANIIINGKSSDAQSVAEYFSSIKKRQPIVKSAFIALENKFDIVVAEGAGSPVELNLMQEDLSNLYIATTFNTKILLVADIERGGVFASIWGVYNLLPEALKANVIGVIINKFRGDMQFFKEGINIIENQFQLKVLGVIPHTPLNVGFEDIHSLHSYQQNNHMNALTVAIIEFPHLSNFTDFEPLINDPSVNVTFISNPAEAKNSELLILPGTKRTVNDLKWLKAQGFETLIKEWKRPLVAICGGYQMLFDKIIDEKDVEEKGVFEGFGRIKGNIIFKKEKLQKRTTTTLFSHTLSGYEIHHGKSKTHPIGYQNQNLYGTFLHGLFDNDCWRNDFLSTLNPKHKTFKFQQFKTEKIAHFTNIVKENINLNYLIQAITNTPKQV